MSVTIKTVESKNDLKKFIRFNYELYKGNPYAVPDLYEDMLNTLSPEKNAAFDFCEARYFLAYKQGRLAGRVAAIINRQANSRWDVKAVRFGWIDFIDDPEVSAALLNAVEEWGKEQGMTEVQGPLGFTDFDPEGMLVEGFDQLGTMATIYNYPYYPQHLERLGYSKDADWVEYKVFVPDEAPEKPMRIARLVAERFKLRNVKYTSRKKLVKDYGQAIFDLVNEAYSPLYGYSLLSQRQIDQYIKMYLNLLDLRMISLVVDQDDRLVAVGVTIPSLSRALQKARGKLFPLGWFHLAKTLFYKHDEILDFLLVAVKPEYQNKGVNGMLFGDLVPILMGMKFKYAETNPELEDNGRVQAQWSFFHTEQHKRRRAYKKELTQE